MVSGVGEVAGGEDEGVGEEEGEVVGGGFRLVEGKLNSCCWSTRVIDLAIWLVYCRSLVGLCDWQVQSSE